MKRKRQVAMSLMAMLALTTAQAQDEPPKQQDPPEPEEAEQKESRRYLLPVIDIGYFDRTVSGNFRKFRQYATPPIGPYLRTLRFEPWFNGFQHGLGIDLAGIGEDDYRAYGSATLNHGTTMAEAQVMRNRFYDSTPMVVDENERRVEEARVRHKITDDIALGFQYSMNHQDNFFEPPRIRQNSRTRSVDLTAEGKVGSGFASASIRNWNYWDRTNVVPDTELKRIRFSYMNDIVPTVNLEGVYSRTLINQSGRPENKVDTYALTGVWDVAPATDLIFDLRRENLDLPVIQNAWVRERNQIRARAVHRWPNWSAELGFRHLEVERVRADQTFVDVPKWSTFEGRVAGRIAPGWRLSARGYRQVLRDRPQMVGSDPRALYFDERNFGQIKLDTGNPIFGGYLVYTQQYLENDERGVEVDVKNWTIGGSWQPVPHFDFYMEHSREDTRASAPLGGGPSLDSFFPGSRLTVFGVNWVFSARTYLSANYTEFVTRNDNPLGLRDGNVSGRFITTSLRHELMPGIEATLSYAPWRYRDRLFPQMGYNAMLLTISASGRF